MLYCHTNGCFLLSLLNEPFIEISVNAGRSTLVGLKRLTLRLPCSSAMKFYRKSVSWRLAASETAFRCRNSDSFTWFLLFLTKWKGRTSTRFPSKRMSMLKLVFFILISFKLDGILAYKRRQVRRLCFLRIKNGDRAWCAAVYDNFNLQCFVPLKDFIVFLSISYQPHVTVLNWSFRKNVQVMR